jgi:CRP-like cAMP-binding protein
MPAPDTSQTADPHTGSPDPSERETLQALVEASLPGIHLESASILADAARLRHVPIEAAIFRQGAEVRLTLILRGYAGFRRTTADGQQVTVGIAYPGELYGISSVSATISTVDMIALTDCVVAVWSGQELRRLAAADAGLALGILDRLAGFLNILTVKLDGFLHQDARRRVVRILARHRDLFFAEPPVLSRAHLPGLVGTSREMTGRVLRQLEHEGTLARVGPAGLRLLDPDRLDAASESGSSEPSD